MAVSCTDLDTLADNAKCILDKTSPEQRQAIIVYLLSLIAGVSADPETLLASAKCIEAGLSETQMRAVQVSLLCAILNK